MAFLKTENTDRRTMNIHLIIVRQPRKKWGKELVIGQSSRPDNVLSLLACANSINFQDVFAFG